MARGFKSEDRQYEDDDEVATFCGAQGAQETERALQVVLSSGRTLWVPKSVIHDDSEVFETGHSGKLVLKMWFALKEGLAE